MSKLRKSIVLITRSVFLAICIYVLLIAVFPPRVFLSLYYILVVFFIVGLFLFVFDFVLLKLVSKVRIPRFLESIQQWSNKKKLLWSVISITVLILLTLLNPVIDNFNDKKVLEEAKEQFLPITYGVISQAKIDRTLVELQKTLDKLRGEYVEKPPDYLIKVHLFSNIDELIKKTGMSEWAGGGTLMLPGKPPELAVPVEQETSIWNSTLPTATPAHEITHVVTFEALQLQDTNLVPRFYEEGIAEYVSLRDYHRFPDRMLNRIRLIFYKNQLTRLELIPTLNIKDKSVKNEDIVLFYRLSHEFTKYLVANYGMDKSWYVVLDVGQGMNFYEAFRKEYNKEYATMYSEFLSYFY